VRYATVRQIPNKNKQWRTNEKKHTKYVQEEKIAGKVGPAKVRMQMWVYY
jgi:hypothetical protein